MLAGIFCARAHAYFLFAPGASRWRLASGVSGVPLAGQRPDPDTPQAAPGRQPCERQATPEHLCRDIQRVVVPAHSAGAAEPGQSCGARARALTIFQHQAVDDIFTARGCFFGRRLAAERSAAPSRSTARSCPERWRAFCRLRRSPVPRRQRAGARWAPGLGGAG